PGERPQGSGAAVHRSDRDPARARGGRVVGGLGGGGRVVPQARRSIRARTGAVAPRRGVGKGGRVKITLYDRESGREFLVRQVVDSHGHNRWTGRPLSNEYTAILAEGLEAVEIAGSALQDALDRIIGMAPDLMIEPDTLIGPLRERVERLNAGAPATAGSA